MNNLELADILLNIGMVPYGHSVAGGDEFPFVLMAVPGGGGKRYATINDVHQKSILSSLAGDCPAYLLMPRNGQWSSNMPAFDEMPCCILRFGISRRSCGILPYSIANS